MATTHDRLQPAAIGFRAHSGWAALVAVAGSAESAYVIARRRIEIADPATEGSKQPFHAAEPMPFKDAAKYLKGCENSTKRLAREAVQVSINELRDKRYQVAGAGIILGSGRPLPELRAILASHALIHTAEGEFFRNALVEASEHSSLPVLGVKERELHDRAAAQLGLTAKHLEQRIAELGRSVGPPWTQDQKYAALVAWMVLHGGGIQELKNSLNS